MESFEIKKNKGTNRPSLQNSKSCIRPISKKNKKTYVGELKSVINNEYLTSEFKNKFKNCWRKCGSPLNQELNKNLDVMCQPFNCAFLPNMFVDEDILNKVDKELQGIELCNKNNDLFKFKCTGNLKLTEKAGIQKLCKIIQGPLKHWVQDVSGIHLTNKVSISSSVYKYSDILLCHDDELEGRRIAFILYLVPTWKKDFGGSLDLFSVDNHGRPLHVEKSLYPQFNSFAFFEVSPVSYHQVSEVLVQNVKRVTINGWFYGKAIEYPPRYMLKPSIFIPPGHVEEHTLYSWINPMYLDENTQIEIRKEFQEKSEIQISNFLKLKQYEELSTAIRAQNIKWKWVGPPYKRHIEVVNRKDMPQIVSEFLSVMQSEAMFLVLSQLTGLSLHRLAPEDSDVSDVEDCNGNSEGSSNKLVEKNLEDKPDCSSFCSKGFSSTSSDEDDNDSTKFLSKKNNKICRKRRKTEKRSAKKKKFENVTKTNYVCESSSKGNNFSLSEDWESDVERETLSEMKLNTDVGEARAEMTYEVRRWRWGSYSLMRDDDLKNMKDFILDAMFFCNGSKDWQIKYGGGTVYVAKGEQEQLLTVLPVPNSLAIVYRDSQTYKFMKHINIKSTQLGSDSIFHEIVCEYREIDKSSLKAIK